MNVQNTSSLRKNLPEHMRMDSMLHLIRLPLCVTDPNLPDNPIVYVNDAFLELTGYQRDEVEGRNCRFLQGPDTTQKSLEEIRNALENRATALVELVNYRKDGSKFINSLQISPIMGQDGTTELMFGSQLDVTDSRLREKEQQKLATAELVHRLKNIVAVMASVIRLSDQEITDRAELLEKIQERLRALSDSHFSTIQPHQGPPLDVASISKLVVEPYAHESADALRITGASAQVGSEYISPLSLALHELATNASKYGAFSVKSGQVEIRWDQNATEDRLIMTWTERGGPEVKPSGRSSGSKMIARLLQAAGGEITYDWRPEGLVAKVSIPAYK